LQKKIIPTGKNHNVKIIPNVPIVCVQEFAKLNINAKLSPDKEAMKIIIPKLRQNCSLLYLKTV
jgi:hypothetical protein